MAYCFLMVTEASLPVQALAADDSLHMVSNNNYSSHNRESNSFKTAIVFFFLCLGGGPSEQTGFAA